MDSFSVLREMGAFVFVLAMIAGVWFLARKSGLMSIQTAKSSSLNMVQSLAVGHRERILLLDVSGERVLIGVSPAGMRTLHVVPVPSREKSP